MTKIILLVEDNPDDVELTVIAFKKNHIANEIVIARDGAEALDYLYGTGIHAGRDLNIMPTVILLDLKLPKMDGLEVLKRLQTNIMDITHHRFDSLAPFGYVDVSITLETKGHTHIEEVKQALQAEGYLL